VFTMFVFLESVLGVGVFWWVYFQGCFIGGYGVPSICGTICILFRSYPASCGDDV
jgi:hypothetical protein